MPDQALRNEIAQGRGGGTKQRKGKYGSANFKEAIGQVCRAHVERTQGLKRSRQRADDGAVAGSMDDIP